MILKIKKIQADAKVPSMAYKGDAGLDLYSAEKKIIKRKERAKIKTGIALEIPFGFVGLIWDRSSLAAKSGLTTMAGVIDSGYRGEIEIIIYNSSKEDYIIKKYDKIAQLLIQKIETPKIVGVDQLSNSERGNKNFGSSGEK